MPKKKVTASLADPVLVTNVKGYLKSAKKESDGKTAKAKFREAIIGGLPGEFKVKIGGKEVITSDPALYLIDKSRVSLAVTPDGKAPDLSVAMEWFRGKHPRIFKQFMAMAEESPKTTNGRIVLNIHPA